MAAVIDGVISTQSQAGLAFFSAASGHKNLGAKRLGHLDGGHADTAGAALDQDALARLQASAIKHIAPYSEKGFGQGGGLDVAQASWHGQALSNGCHAVLGIAATRNQGTDPLTNGQASLRQRQRIAICDDARHLQTRNIRGTRGHRIVAGAL